MGRHAQQGSEWRDGFLFVGNHTALDFLNTQPVMGGKPVELMPNFEALLRWLCAAELFSRREVAVFRKDASSSNVLHRTLHFRERLRREIVSLEAGKSVHRSLFLELNSLMAEYPAVNEITTRGSQPVIQIGFRLDSPEALLGPIAYHSAKLLTEEDPSRIRQCGGCVLHFLDTSKKGTRHWCSMRFCGNRNKAAAFAARQRITLE